MWIVVMYLWAVNALALLAFGWDKLRAGRRKRRIPERRLLWLAALGGSPGAVLGRWIFKHKTRKSRFGFGLYAILCVQAGLVYFVLSGNVPSTFW
ncbi:MULTISPECIES: DUF1294 domain-containing protein [unclassified Ruegeria]|uniref:DUF1294 domain-containing protein n=2 Tax=Ruegeria TaxID=97050 RepID=UPI00148868B5|nr:MULTISPECIES: DUF1294 domain-containing protein [unclassified Ruegeria]